MVRLSLRIEKIFCCCYRLKLTASQKNDLRHKMADDLVLNKSEKLLQTCVKKSKLAVRCIICNEECSEDFQIKEEAAWQNV